jgi:hypothetical protein
MTIEGYKLAITGGSWTDHIIDVGLPTIPSPGRRRYDLTGLAPSTLYSIKVAAYNDVPNESGYSAAQTATTDAGSALLDGLTTTVKLAYGLFKMRAAYTGPAIRVKDSLAVQADIGFDGGGNLDVAALSGNSPYKIVTWYDQKNSNDATNSTGANEPTLDTTAVACRFNGASTQFLSLPDLSALTAGEAFCYRKIDNDPSTSGDGSGGLWWFGTEGSGSGAAIPYSDSKIYDAFGSTVRQANGVTYTGPLTNYHVYSAYSAAGDWADYLNGTLLYHSGTNAVSFQTTPVLGKAPDGLAMSGPMRAFVLFQAKVTSGERTTFSDVASYVP